MESVMDYHAAKALLEWQVELGANEAILDAPVDRYALEARPKPAAKAKSAAPALAQKPSVNEVAVAQAAAKAAADLPALQAALANFEHCALKRGARSLVFGEGNPSARVMIIGGAPDREEDRAGKPFAGRAGELLDRMLAAIDMGREAEGAASVYLTCALPWRPPSGQEPDVKDIEMLTPFLARQVELVAPEIIVLMGNVSLQAALGKRGLSRLRGNWQEAFGCPALPMSHPADLMRTPVAKREAWADLLSLQSRLKGQADAG